MIGTNYAASEWDQFPLAPPEPAPAASGGRGPTIVGSIPGRPKPRDTFEDERRAAADERAEEASSRAQVQFEERDDPRPPAGYRAGPGGSLIAIPGGPADKVNDPLIRQGELKSNAFAIRALGANRDYEKTGVGPRSMVGQNLSDTMPSLLNSLPAVVGNSPERQVADSAQDEFIAASLRQDSGAAIPDSELDRQRRIYFPMPGDGPEAIEQKRGARLRALEGLMASSGSAVTDEQRAAYEAFKTGEAQDVRSAIAGGTATAGRSEEAASPEPPDDEALNIDVEGGRMPTEAELAADPELRAAWGEALKDTGGLNAFGRGVADSLTLGFSDELAGAGEAMAGAVKGDGSFGELYDHSVSQGRARMQADEQQHPYASMGGKLAGGVALPGFGARGAVGLAKVGAGYGAAHGAGSANGGIMDRLFGGASGAASGAAVGGALGAVGAGIGSKLAARGPGAPPRSVALKEAADRQGVPLTVPDVAPRTRTVFGSLEAVPGAGGAVRKALDSGNQRIEQRVGEMGGGTASSRPDIGETIRGAGERYVGRSRDVVKRAYGIAEQRANGQAIKPTEAVKVLDDHIAELNQTPETNSAIIKALNSLRDDMIDPGGGARSLGVGAIRGLRTSMRGRINSDELRGTDAERRVGEALDAAGRDISSQLQGPAARAYKRADGLHKGRVENIDRVVKQFLGGRGDGAFSPEAVVGRLEAKSRPATGDGAAVSKMMAMLKPDEREEVGATIASQLGRRGTDGNNQFSPAAFFSQVQQFSPSARKAIWGEQGAKDLADLARIAEQRGNVVAKQNHSGSGRASNFQNAVIGILSGAGLGSALGSPAAGGGVMAGAMASSYGLAKVLGSPRAVSALVYAAKATTLPKQATAVRRITALAAREPDLAEDLLPVKEQLEQAWASDQRSKPRD